MKLFVGNLPFAASESEIRSLFEAYGSITDFYLPLDRDTGRPRGFAFVTFDSQEAGEAAIRGLDGTEFSGRNIRVSEAIERERLRPSNGPSSRGGGGGGGRGGRGGDFRGGRGGGGGRDQYRRRGDSDY